jgi:hypothetical protein
MDTRKLVISHSGDLFVIREHVSDRILSEGSTIEQCFTQIGRLTHSNDRGSLHLVNNVPVGELHGNFAGEWLLISGHHESVHPAGEADSYFLEPACNYCGYGIRDYNVPLAATDPSPICEIQLVGLYRNVTMDGQCRQAGPGVYVYAEHLLEAIDPTGQILGMCARTQINHARGGAMHEITHRGTLRCVAARDCQDIGIMCNRCGYKYVKMAPNSPQGVQYFVREDAVRMLTAPWCVLEDGGTQKFVIHKDLAPRVLNAADSRLVSIYHIAVVPRTLERLVKYSCVWGI